MKVIELVRKLVYCDPDLEVEVIVNGTGYMFDVDGNEHEIKFKNESFLGIECVTDNSKNVKIWVNA